MTVTSGILFNAMRHQTGLLVAVRWDARCSSSLRIGGGSHRLDVGFLEDGLDDMLLFRAENLGQAVVELWLFLLEAWRGGGR